MSEHKTTSGEERARAPLAIAMAELADTMPDDPFRVDGIHAKARRLRTRRRAIRATAGVVVGAATVAMLVAVRPGPTHLSTVPAGQPSTTTGLPSCGSALAAVTDAETKPETMPGGSGTDSAAADAKRAAASEVDAASPITTGRGVKGFGSIVSATDESVTITLAEPGRDDPSQIAATLSPDAEFVDGNQGVDIRPALNAGDRVAFGATKAIDGSYQLIFLAVNVPDPLVSASATLDPATKEAIAIEPSPFAKATAEVVGVQPDSLTLTFGDGPLAGQTMTVATGPDTIYIAGGQKCVDPQLAVGQGVGVLLLAGDNGTYTIQEVSLEQPTATSAP